jgi:hypothetical protein
MSIIKKTIHTATGEFQVGGGFAEPELPALDSGPPVVHDPDYSIVAWEGDRLPDPRTEKWNGSAVVNKSQAEVDEFDATQPLWVDGREIMRRLADSTHLGLDQLAQTDATVTKLWNTLRAGGNVDVHSTEFIAGAAHLESVGIPSVWPDVATFDAELLAVSQPFPA